MQVFAATWYLVALMVVTAALPRSHSSVPQGIQHPKDPLHYRAPAGCRNVRAQVRHDNIIDLKLVKRDSQLPETDAGAVHPRNDLLPLPCGLLHGGHQSEKFQFWTTETVQLVWHFGNHVVTYGTVRLMRVHPNGPDVIEQVSRAGANRFRKWKPVLLTNYYLEVFGEPSTWMTWSFRFCTLSCHTFYFRVLTRPNEQIIERPFEALVSRGSESPVDRLENQPITDDGSER
ncbi:hypothetical protein MMC07_009649 [Pseudocyphellaria aurata]|nr:hypothetical protein [Pseudocyphellaria aurata]